MDIIVLGLLMIQKCTVYEMRKMIDMCFSSISSNSMGSIQAAIKKLLGSGMIQFDEYVDNGINKKVYEVTLAGKRFFYSAISLPMRYKDKNMELSKFFFMGFMEKENWSGLIDGYINELKKKKMSLEVIRSVIENNPAIDEEYVNRLRKDHSAIQFDECADPVECIKGIALFQCATLRLGIDKLAFEIEWFEQFKDSIEEEK